MLLMERTRLIQKNKKEEEDQRTAALVDPQGLPPPPVTVLLTASIASLALSPAYNTEQKGNKFVHMLVTKSLRY